MNNSRIYNGKPLYLLFLTVLLSVCTHVPQLYGQDKGLKPRKQIDSDMADNTYALVIGISDYKDEGIPDLAFADKDALAFIKYLQSDAGGKLNKDHIKLLLNEDATTGRIVESFDWLISQCGKGDRAIIYFSGHSDVESITKNQRGFLLTHDTPSRSYIAGGFALIFLNDVISTLSDNDVKVILISDACRAGKLAGSNIGGPQYTSTFLAKQFANEIKILACQADEFSLEGKEWGGGRGLFSYHLVNGLYGLADENKDRELKLIELDRYLEKEVALGAAPLNQNPLTVGNRNEVISFLNDRAIEGSEGIHQEVKLFYDVAVRSYEASLLEEHSDTTVQQWYKKFVEYVEAGQFFEPQNECAEYYYQKLLGQRLPEKFTSSITRFYAAQLQDKAQDVLLRILNEEIVELTKRRIDVIRSYRNFPSYLERAAELLGKTHYMYDNLKSRQLFFEGLISWNIYYLSSNKEKEVEILDNFTKALTYQQNAPHIIKYIGLCHATITNQLDSAELYMDNAMKLAPTWISPYYSLAYILARRHGQFDKAQQLLSKANSIDSSHISIAICLAAIKYYESNFEEAKSLFESVLKKHPLNTTILHNLGNTCFNLGRFDEAEKYLKQAIKLEPDWCDPHYSLGFLFAYFERWDEAVEELIKANKSDPYFVPGRKKLAVVYYRIEAYDLSERTLLEAYVLAPNDLEINYNLACLKSINGDFDSAIKYLAFMVEAKYISYDNIIEEPDLEKLRQDNKFITFLEKYYPDKLDK